MGIAKNSIPKSFCPKCGKSMEEVTTGTSTESTFCKCKTEKPTLVDYTCPSCKKWKNPITGYCNCNNHW